MRYMLIDRVTDMQPGKFVRGIRNITLTEDVLATHFPNFPILPGVLITDTMAQVATWGSVAGDAFRQRARLVALRGAKFRRYVRAGDQLTVEAQFVGQSAEGRPVWRTKACVGGKPIASVAEMEFELEELSERSADLERRRYLYCGGQPIHELLTIDD
jgi:3-hydroxyacyl-[acyl-carrier-protein] dehydratase